MSHFSGHPDGGEGKGGLEGPAPPRGPRYVGNEDDWDRLRRLNHESKANPSRCLNDSENGQSSPFFLLV